jgi:hypothetical protein
MRTRTSAYLALGIALLLSSCSRVDSSQVVGSVEKIKSETAFINGKQTSAGDQLYERQKVSTNGRGRVALTVTEKVPSLDLLTNSEIVVVPGRDALLEMVRGTALCRTTKSPQRIEMKTPGGIIRASDPAFWVSIDGDRTQVGVLFGFVELRSQRLGGPVLIGPGHLSSMTRDRIPDPPTAWATNKLAATLRPAVLEFRDEYLATYPPDFSAPSPLDFSPALARILRERRLDVAVDESHINDRGARTFLDGFFGLLGSSRSWNVQVKQQVLSPKRATAALKAGAIDVFVSPGPVPRGATPILLLRSPDGPVWWINVQQDGALEEALERFLIRALQYGEYAKFFEAGFPGTFPVYEDFARLVGP